MIMVCRGEIIGVERGRALALIRVRHGPLAFKLWQIEMVSSI